jgi:hypothetical protein
MGDKKLSYDHVRNSWNMRDGVIVFDIETDRIIDFSLQGKKNREFKCAVAYSYKDGKYHLFQDAKELIEFLRTAKALVTYNGEGFDFIVLERFGISIKPYKNGRWVPERIESLDIMHKIQDERETGSFEKKYPSLEEMILSHYGVWKTSYDPDDPKDLLLHCMEDVKYTKMLYEEEYWQVPIKKRAQGKKWDTDYDNDVNAVVDDGENCTRIVDFGLPISDTASMDLMDESLNTVQCPLCEKGELFMYEVLRCRTDEVECPECHGIIEFVTGTLDVMLARTKEEIEDSKCPNCKKDMSTRGHSHYGYGAGSGYISSGRELCQKCKKGCYEWERENTPGFRDHFIGKCCHCGE